MNRLSGARCGAALVLLALCAAPAAAETLYGITFAGDQLLSIDPKTGAGSVIGPINPPIRPVGLAFRGNNLYAYDELSHLVVQLDPATGATVGTTNVGTKAFGEGDLDFRADGIGFLSTVGPPSQLTRFDLTVPSSAVVGTLSQRMDGLAFNAAGVLYGLQEKGVALYTIDPATAAMTLVGNTGISSFPNNGGGGLAFNAAGELYGTVCNSGIAPSFLYRIDPATGSATLIGPIGFNGVTGIRFAPVPTAPKKYPGEGSYKGCKNQKKGSEGGFGNHVTNQVGGSALPALLGPFLETPATESGWTPISSAFALSPEGAALHVFNSSCNRAGSETHAAAPVGAEAFGWLLLTVLSVVAAALVKQGLSRRFLG